jgi:WD40 repeat protein/class 3 adenylate cyclase
VTPKLPAAQRSSAIRTFLIADIRGWTRFTRELGDEAASRLAAKFAQIVGEGVEAWGGQLLELRGDEAMCTFESARRALRCAVELQEAFVDEAALAPELPLNVGIGLDAGEAVPVGDGYRGTALNVAARLCSTAAAGEVIATASLAHLAGRVDGLAFAELEPKPMKGFDAPVAAVLVDSAAPHEHDDAPQAATPGPAVPLPAELDAIVPLVGREADLRWLSWFWRRARHGHGGVVAISGVPGIGRTRLAAELASMAHRDGAVVAYGPDGDGELVVIDDVDQVSAGQAGELDRVLGDGGSRRLVVLTARDSLAAAIAPSEERQRRLVPIDLAAVTEIGRLYLDDPEVDVPAHLLLEESHGIPAAVHRVASQWGAAAARRRLGESARRTSRERRDLRAAEAEMIGDVERLELTRERARLYVPELEPQAAEDGAARAVCPYKGLATFEATDAEYYFGRERLVAELIARMVGSSFVGLIGASGSGKSSALQAGLLPALAGGVIPGSDEWIQVQVRPGEHPMWELPHALRRSLPHQPPEESPPAESLEAALSQLAPAQRLLVVVDQFEELFTSVVDEGERTEFIDLLTEERPRTKVLVAVRADHYERCAAYPRLARLIGADQVLVGPLTAAEIAAIIRHPAERVGLRVDPELVEALVADIGTEPGGLPLLSTALLELWEARDGDRLTLSAYRATGGVRGAVARLAESVYARLDADEQAETRSIFLRLAGETDDRAIVRRRVSLDELDLGGAPRSDAAVGALTRGRLLTASEGYVEVSHEALLREWPRLRSWIVEDSSGRQLRLHLMSAARTWDEGGREEGDLYRGARLAAVLDWSEEHERELNALERAFVEESRVASEREAERQRRTNRRLRGLLAGSAILLVLALGAGAYALTQAGLARDQAVRAQSAEGRAEAEAEAAQQAAVTARARELFASAISVVEHDPELSLHLYLAAMEHGVEPSEEAITALHQALLTTRAVRTFRMESEGRRPSNVGAGISPSGATVFASVDSRSIRSFDTGTGEAIRTYGEPGRDRTAPHLGVTVSPDGRLIAQVDEDGVVRVWDVATGSERRMQARGETADWSVFSPDGTRLATMTFDPEHEMAVVSLFDLDPARLVAEWELEELYAVGFDMENDRLLATACPCNLRDAVLWLDIATETVSNPFEDAEPWVELPTSAQFSPDGQMLATATEQGVVQLWSTQTLELLETFIGHARDVSYIGFSADGQLLATTSNDGTIRVWDVESGTAHLTLAGQSGVPNYAAFSQDKTLLVTASSDLSVTVWDLSLARGQVPGIDLGEEISRVWDLEVRGDHVAAMGWTCRTGGCAPGEVRRYHWREGTVEEAASGRHGLGLALLPDGSVVSQAGVEVGADGESQILGGDLEIRKADETIVLEGVCSSTQLSNDECGYLPEIPWQVTVFNIEAAANGEVIAALGASTAQGDSELEFVDTLATWDETGALLAGPLVIDDPALALAISPDGSQVAVSTIEYVEILDASSLESLEILELTWVGVLRYSPDGKTLAIGSMRTPTRLYDTSTWEFTALDTHAVAMDWSPTGERFATVDVERRLRIQGLPSHEAAIQMVPLERIQLRRAHIARWGFIRFVDEQHLLVADDASAYMISLDHEELLEAARSRLTRDLTADECARYRLECPAGSES